MSDAATKRAEALQLRKMTVDGLMRMEASASNSVLNQILKNRPDVSEAFQLRGLRGQLMRTEAATAARWIDDVLRKRPDVRNHFHKKGLEQQLNSMDAATAAKWIDEVLSNRPDVRFQFQKLLPNHGKSWGARGRALVHAGPYYNAPTACVAAVTRMGDSGEWELLVGRRPENHVERSGNQTLLGGYFAPYLPKECAELFEMAESWAHQRDIAAKEHYKGLLEVPPTNLYEDVRNRDTDLEATVRKELFQEAGIFLVPKGLKEKDRDKLVAAVQKVSDNMIASGERQKPVVITEQYDIIDRVLPYSGVGTAEPTRQTCSMGFVVVLHGNGEFNDLQPGDDIADVEWVPQSNLSTSMAPEPKAADDNTVYLGNMRDGDPEIIDHAFKSLISEVPLKIKNIDGDEIYCAKSEQLILKIDRICETFGLKRSDVLGELPDPPIGPEAAIHHKRMVSFMEQHYAQVVKPYEADMGKPFHEREFSLEELFAAEKSLLLKFAESSANPQKVKNAAHSIDFGDFLNQSVSRMAIGLLPTEAFEQTSTVTSHVQAVELRRQTPRQRMPSDQASQAQR